MTTTAAPTSPRATGTAPADTTTTGTTTTDSTPTSTSAKVLYRPVGLISSVLGGLLANLIFKKVWQQAAPAQAPEPPTALDPTTGLKTILLAAGLQGAIFAVVKVLIDRGGARVFAQWSGEWPGD